MKNEKLNLCKNCKAVYTPLLFCASCSYHNPDLEVENIKYRIKKEKSKEHPLNIELFRYPLKVWHSYNQDRKDKNRLKYLLKKTKQLLIKDGYLSGRKPQ